MTNNSNTTQIPPKRNFNLMVLGQIISILGASLLRFALSLYILDTTGNESLFATLYAISSIPLLLSPIGGAIADRFNRRNLMVIFDFTSSATVLCLLLLMKSGKGSILVIGTIMVILSTISALYTPTVTASIPLLVEDKKLGSANGIVQAVQALSGTVAPILGGVLYGILGVQILIIISSVAFFLSAVMEIFIFIPFVKRSWDHSMATTIAADLKDGFAFVLHTSFIFKAILLAAAINFLLSPLFIVGAPIILKVSMESSDTIYGIGMSLIQFSTIVGALLAGFFMKNMKANTVYRWCLTIALMIIPMALSITPAVLDIGYFTSLATFLFFSVLVTAAMTIMSIYVITQTQQHTPNENLGKVMAIVMSVAQCAAPLGQIIYGFVFKAFRTNVFIPVMAVSLAMLVVTAVTKHTLRNEGELTIDCK